jgi:GLPGLI family protein
MRTFSLLALLIMMGVMQSFAQPVSGRVTYVATVRNSLWRNVADKIDTTQLYFSETACSYVMDQGYKGFTKADSAEFQARFPDSWKSTMATMQKLKDFHNETFSYHQAGTNTGSSKWSFDLEKRYCLVDTFPEIEWVLTPDTMRVLGFLCQKATCTSSLIGKTPYQFTAWYTPDIPASYGPRNFFGLPGLILILDSKYFNYKATAVKIPLRPDETIRLSPCSELPLISRDEAEKMQAKQRADLMNMKNLRNNQ